MCAGADPAFYRALNERMQESALLGPYAKSLNDFAGVMSGTVTPREFGAIKAKQLDDQFSSPEGMMNFLPFGGVTAWHGSRRAFDKFDLAAPKTTLGGFNTRGVSLSPDEAVAARYAKDFSNEPGYVYKVDADVAKPLALRASEFEKLQHIVGKRNRGEPLTELEDVGAEMILTGAGVKFRPGQDPIDAIRSAGFDHITKDSGRHGIAEREWLVFDPERLKILERKRAK